MAGPPSTQRAHHGSRPRQRCHPRRPATEGWYEDKGFGECDSSDSNAAPLSAHLKNQRICRVPAPPCTLPCTPPKCWLAEPRGCRESGMPCQLSHSCKKALMRVASSSTKACLSFPRPQSCRARLRRHVVHVARADGAPRWQHRVVGEVQVAGRGVGGGAQILQLPAGAHPEEGCRAADKPQLSTCSRWAVSSRPPPPGTALRGWPGPQTCCVPPCPASPPPWYDPPLSQCSRCPAHAGCSVPASTDTSGVKAAAASRCWGTKTSAA